MQDMENSQLNEYMFDIKCIMSSSLSTIHFHIKLSNTGS